MHSQLCRKRWSETRGFQWQTLQTCAHPCSRDSGTLQDSPTHQDVYAATQTNRSQSETHKNKKDKACKGEKCAGACMRARFSACAHTHTHIRTHTHTHARTHTHSFHFSSSIHQPRCLRVWCVRYNPFYDRLVLTAGSDGEVCGACVLSVRVCVCVCLLQWIA